MVANFLRKMQALAIHRIMGIDYVSGVFLCLAMTIVLPYEQPLNATE